MLLPHHATLKTCYNIPDQFRRQAISSIIIDGYNLIGTQHRDLRQKREALIRQIIEYNKSKAHDITVVFDGWKDGSGRQEQNIIAGIKVIYSRLGDRADSVIQQILEEKRREWIVVTSDRQVAGCAWKNGSVPVESERFMDRLGNVSDSADKDYSGHLYDDSSPKRGNPRQLSRKEKAVIRALNKL